VNWAETTELRAAGAESPTALRRGAAAIWISRLTLSDFRCYGQATLEADARPLVLTGPNGAGKTNLLEAVSFLAPGRGLRSARLGEMDRVAPDAEFAGPDRPWAVAARVMTPDGPRDLGTGRDPAGQSSNGRERRLVKVDGIFARGQQALGEVVGMIWLTPQMDGLFREGAPGRRRFLDRLVYCFDPAHAGRVSAYEQVMRERARLLRSVGGDAAWLASLEDSMARRGVAIAAARRALLVRLAGACEAGAGPFPRAGLGLVGEVESWLDGTSALEAEDRLRDRLAKTRGQDAETGGAAVGPHRSDMAVRHLETGVAAELCSTGEQKALLISIVLAHGRLLALERSAAPLMLLDEIVAHLDAQRRSALFEELLALGAQVWLTGTDIEVFDELRDAAQFFQVHDAQISRPDA